MDRTPYQLPFFTHQIPAWLCPACHAGHLTLDKKNLLKSETSDSAREHQHEAWEPDWIRYVFSCIFQCNNPNCKEPVTCTGTGRVEIVYFEDEEHGWAQSTDERFTPQYFHPHLVLMDIPTGCPEEVCSHLNQSFTLFFADSGAAMNCARAAVEAFLTSLGIKRFSTVKGKRRPINLHQRIELLPEKYKDLSDLLLAVKWLGNAGSHDGDKTTEADVRIMYDLLEHVLSEVYEGKNKKLKAIAKKVNKNKGPIK
ncbi:DUF4145 domain-containing protein [Pseudomonas tohonis]|uniref:DUF4145 domain-containing protein n=1 Tax=Pseudomonas tohonis TaxID=2725477 RepID=UPI0022F0EB04|nr:DUF4145 domain-containing protein [Pseudomonas tohonis]